MMVNVQSDGGVTAAAALADPLRRRVYDTVASAPSPLARDDVAHALGIGTSLAGYHLELLAAQGLLAVSSARRNGRVGPGAGRPAKLYARAQVEIQVQLPPRDDALLADLLATAVERDGTGAAHTALTDVARETGESLGRQLAGRTGAEKTVSTGDVLAVLSERGYEAYEIEGVIRMRNCPFHHLTDRHLQLVCGLNHALLTGLVDGAGLSAEASLQPTENHCCVRLKMR